MLIDEINIKLVILGVGGVGKTSIVKSFLNQDFPKRYIPTIGSSISRKEYMLKDIAIKVIIWDIGGQKSFNPLNPVSFANIDAAFLVFDLSQPKETLPELESDFLANLSKYTDECVAFIIGNKLDLISTEEELEIIAKHYTLKDIPLVLTSAKTSENLSNAFELIVYIFLKEWEKRLVSEKFHGISGEFLNLINKKEKELKELFVNLKNIDSILISRKTKPQLSKKEVLTSTPHLDSQATLPDYIKYKQKLEEFDKIKEQIIDSFNSKLSLVQDLILKLEKTPIDSLSKSIENTIEQIKKIKGEFELSLDSLLNLKKSKKEIENETIETNG